MAKVAAGSSGSEPFDFRAAGSLVYFQASTDATGRELFAMPIAALMDSDLDGLDFAAETAAGTDPFAPDTDDDGLSDGAELLTFGTDPLDADTDGDGYTDGEEIVGGSDPLDPESVPQAIPMSGPLGLGVLAALLVAAGSALAQRRAQ